MMLVGHCGVGKSATANIILGKEAFRETETTQCDIQEAGACRRIISVIDTPGINNTSLTTEQWRKELMRGVMLSSPGPHVFLLVIKVGRVSEEGINAVKWIREYFGEEALTFSMILFIGREEMTNKQWVTFSEDAGTRALLSSCGGRYCAINSKKECNSSQIFKLLSEVECMIKQNRDKCYTSEMYEAVASSRKTEVIEMKEKITIGHKPKPKQVTCVEVQKEKYKTGFDVKHGNVIPPKKQEEPVTSLPERKTGIEGKFVKEDLRRQEETLKAREKKKLEKERGATGGATPEPVCDVRIVLLGGAGAGKSSSGNTILGKEAFGKDIVKVTTMGKRQDGMVGHKSVSVIDTKGYNQGASQHYFWKYCDELETCLSLCRPGPHIFVLVVPSPTNFSFPNQLLYKRFGPEVLKRTLILITHGDSLERNRNEVLKDNPALRQLVQHCGEDYYVLNNQKKEEQTQVTELMQKIEVLIRKNGQGYCTTEMFQRKGQQESSCTLI